MDVNDLPWRSNGDTVKVDASWWNDIKLVLLGILGPGVIGTTKQVLPASQTSVVTGMVFNPASVIDFKSDYTVKRGTTRQSGVIRGYYDTEWRLAHESEDYIGVDFSINSSTGQVTAANDGGECTLQWRTPSTFGPEDD